MHRRPSLKRRWLVRQTFQTSYYELEVDGKPLRYVGSSAIARRRIRTLFEKEPTTIVWLNSFEPGEILVDVGANVGMYSMYAAAIRGAKVFAFEPEGQSFAELNRNIYVNGLQQRATAWPLAVSDEEKMSTLFLSRFGTGWGEHNFDTPSEEWGVAFTQGSVSTSLDRLVEAGTIPLPHHIKVDVDGLEWRVFNGMQKTLLAPEVKTVLIETNFKLEKSVAIIEQMTRLGWRFSRDQARINQHEIVPYEEIERRMRAGTHGQNFIYFRDPAYERLFADYARTFVPPNPIKDTPVTRVRRRLGRVKRAIQRRVFQS